MKGYCAKHIVVKILIKLDDDDTSEKLLIQILASENYGNWIIRTSTVNMTSHVICVYYKLPEF